MSNFEKKNKKRGGCDDIDHHFSDPVHEGRMLIQRDSRVLISYTPRNMNCLAEISCKIEANFCILDHPHLLCLRWYVMKDIFNSILDCISVSVNVIQSFIKKTH